METGKKKGRGEIRRGRENWNTKLGGGERIGRGMKKEKGQAVNKKTGQRQKGSRK